MEIVIDIAYIVVYIYIYIYIMQTGFNDTLSLEIPDTGLRAD